MDGNSTCNKQKDLGPGPIRQFSNSKAATTSIEFAVAGSAFCFLLLLILLFGLYYLRITMIDWAVQTVSRKIMVGQVLTQAQFVASIQAASYGLLQSQTINVAVQSAASFGAITPVTNISSAGLFPYNTGTYGSAVLVQVGYTDSTLAKFLPTIVSSVSSSIAFQREPSP